MLMPSTGKLIFVVTKWNIAVQKDSDDDTPESEF